MKRKNEMFRVLSGWQGWLVACLVLSGMFTGCSDKPQSVDRADSAQPQRVDNAHLNTSQAKVPQYVTPEDSARFEALKRRVEQGGGSVQANARDQYQLGSRYFYGGGVTQDYAEAEKWWRKAAEQGDSGAMYALGKMYDEGRVVAQDGVEAVKWYQKAAEQGHESAYIKLIEMYDEGRGIAQSSTEALEWERKLAKMKKERQEKRERAQEARDEEARRREVAQKASREEKSRQFIETGAYAEAVKRYQTAAEQGNAEAQIALGMVHASAQNYAEAVKWIRKAAEQGDANGQYILATVYAEGRNVAQDDAEAVKWYQKAAGQGHSEARRELERREKNRRLDETVREMDQRDREAEELVGLSELGRKARRDARLARLKAMEDMERRMEEHERKREERLRNMSPEERKALEQWERNREIRRGEPRHEGSPLGAAKQGDDATSRELAEKQRSLEQKIEEARRERERQGSQK